MSKKPNQSSFLGEFQVIRPLIQLLGYGCFYRKVGVELLDSPSTYSKNLLFLRQYIPKYLKERKKGKLTILYFPSDSYHVQDNQLALLYSIKSITVERLFYKLFILFILGRSKEPIGFPKIFKSLETDIIQQCQHPLPDNYIGDDQKVRRHIAALVKEGAVHKIRQGNIIRYTLIPDILSTLTPEECKELYEGVRFYRNIALLNVPGAYIQQTMTKRFNIPPHQFFQIKNNNIIRITDDEIINAFIQAIQKKTIISCKYKTAPTDMFPRKERKIVGLPFKIETDYLYNRQYIHFNEKGVCHIYRVDRLQDIEDNDEKTLPPPIKKPQTNAHVLSLRLYHSTESEKTAIYQRIRTHFPQADIQKDTDTQSYCKLTVPDPRKLLPWLRTLHPYTQILPSDDPTVMDARNRMIQSIQEALKNYGSI